MKILHGDLAILLDMTFCVLLAFGVPAVRLVIEGGEGVFALAHFPLLGALPRAPILQPLQQVPSGALSLAGYTESCHLSMQPFHVSHTSPCTC